jgi:uncharacterized protein (DUF2141 family)
MMPNPSVVTSQTTITDVRGQFRFTDLPRTTYSLVAYGADGGDTITDQIAAGTTNARVTLVSSGTIEGTLADFGPLPSVNATNHLDMARIAAVDGTHFSIAGLRAGTYSVTAQDDHGGDAEVVEVHAGQTSTVALQARGNGRIAVRVVDATTNQPLIGNRVIAEPVDASGMGAWWNMQVSAMVDASGQASISVPAGRLRVTLRGGACQRDIDVPANGVVSLVLASVPDHPGGAGDAGFTMLDDQLPPTVLSVRLDPALHSGLAVGDQILTVDGVSTACGVEGVAQVLTNHTPGSTATLGIARGSARLTITLRF